MATRRTVLLIGLAGALAGSLRARAQTSANTEWRHYAADLANTRYAPLDQIHGGNFNTLKVAWQFRPDALGPHPEINYEGTPFVHRRPALCHRGHTPRSHMPGRCHR